MEKLNNTYGGLCYQKEIKEDLLHEPVVVCDYEKRRRCDSAYIKLYKDLKKEFDHLVVKYENSRRLLKIYQDILNESVERMKGGDNDE